MEAVAFVVCATLRRLASLQDGKEYRAVRSVPFQSSALAFSVSCASSDTFVTQLRLARRSDGPVQWSEEFIDVINANNINRDEYWDSREQLDAQVRVNVTDRVSVIAEVVNLTDESRRELTGPGGTFLQEDASFGRTFWVGLSATF